MNSPLRLGLTGGIGSGKSTVAALLERHGAAIIDTDAIARQLTQPGGRAISALRIAFGHALIDADGALNRKLMRELAFTDPQAKQRLEAIMHPLIGVEAELQAAASSAALQVFDIPLLVETGHWRSRLHKVLVIDCDESTQLERVMQRPGWTQASAQAVIGQQASRMARRAASDAVIYNDGINMETLAHNVVRVMQSWRTLL
jgi:dephospho-CoA kinase